MDEILCKNCIKWVNCGNKENRPYGFCLAEDLFTYTARTKCSEYTEENPITENEYEDYNAGICKKNAD